MICNSNLVSKDYDHAASSVSYLTDFTLLKALFLSQGLRHVFQPVRAARLNARPLGKCPEVSAIHIVLSFIIALLHFYSDRL
jgi:hypothetical protein